jgi:hypothetical protein
MRQGGPQARLRASGRLRAGGQPGHPSRTVVPSPQPVALSDEEGRRRRTQQDAPVAYAGRSRTHSLWTQQDAAGRRSRTQQNAAGRSRRQQAAAGGPLSSRALEEPASGLEEGRGAAARLETAYLAHGVQRAGACCLETACLDAPQAPHVLLLGSLKGVKHGTPCAPIDTEAHWCSACIHCNSSWDCHQSGLRSHATLPLKRGVAKRCGIPTVTWDMATNTVHFVITVHLG